MTLRYALAALLCAVLAGCGFHLRGVSEGGSDYPPVSLQQSHSDNAVRQKIVQQFAMHNIPVDKEASLHVAVDSVKRSNTEISLFADARSAERRLLIEARVRLLDEKLNVLHETLIRDQRTLFNDPDNPVGSGTEAQLLINELEGSIAERLALQVARWLESQPLETKDATETRPAQ